MAKPKINEEVQNEGAFQDDFSDLSTPSEGGDFLDVDVSDAVDEVALPDGTEAQLRCTAASAGVSQAGNPYWMLTYAVADEPYSKDIRYFLQLPQQSDDPKTLNRKKNKIKYWKQAHSIGLGEPISLESCVGLEAWALLGLEDNGQYGEQNYIKRWTPAP